MRLPEQLAAAIQREAAKAGRGELARASGQLTLRYKAADFGAPVVKSDADRAAYLAVRVPAIYAANSGVFAEMRRLVPETCAGVASLLDLGAGPGTALWAAVEAFPDLRSATLVESDAAWLRLGRRIAECGPHPVLRQARWIRQDLRTGIEFPEHDVVVISYALGELAQPAARTLLLQAWNLAGRFLAVVEPGTPRGFAVVQAARALLIERAASVLAPCPHDLQCPMAATKDWCHFARRIPRTSLHRQLKRGALGYEDEKFSYVVAGRLPRASAAARIIRHPQKHGGHVSLKLCTRHGIEDRTVARSQERDYPKARRSEWGQSWGD